MAEPKVGEVVETQFGTMTVPETKYPFRQLEAIPAMMLAGHGPVAIADKIGKSRPTTNKMIVEARDVFALAQAHKPDFKAGDNKKAQKAARLKAEGFFSEIISWKLRLFCPPDPTGIAVLERLHVRCPVTGLHARGGC